MRTPPQLASDIFDDGIVLSGGAAGLARLPEAIYTALHIPCGVADDPQTSVVLGCGIAVEDPGAYAPCSTTAARVSSACKQLQSNAPRVFPEPERHGALFCGKGFVIPCVTIKCGWISPQNQMNSNEIKRNQMKSNLLDEHPFPVLQYHCRNSGE